MLCVAILLNLCLHNSAQPHFQTSFLSSDGPSLMVMSPVYLCPQSVSPHNSVQPHFQTSCLSSNGACLMAMSPVYRCPYLCQLKGRMQLQQCTFDSLCRGACVSTSHQDACNNVVLIPAFTFCAADTCLHICAADTCLNLLCCRTSSEATRSWQA